MNAVVAPAPLRVGIVGTGFMARVHAQAVRADGGLVTAVAGRTADRAAAAAPGLHATRVAGSVAELVADPDVDVVDVCTPNHLHREIAEQALRAGKHVVCEKPLALSPGDAADLTRLAAGAGVVAAVPFVYRFYAAVREARERIRRGDLGRLWLLHGVYLQDWLLDGTATDWRVDPGSGGPSRAFADIGVHWCDLMEFVTGHRVIALSATTVRAHEARADVPVQTEDGAVVVFRTDRGASGSVLVSQASAGRKNALRFSFDGLAGAVAFDQEHPEELWLGGPREIRLVPRDAGTLSGPAAGYAVLPGGHPQGYQDCFTAFYRDVAAAVRGEQVDGLPTFADGCRAARITAAVLDSASRTGDWVDVS